MKLYPEDWRHRVTTAVVIAACIIAARTFGSGLGLHGFWLGMLVPIIVGIVLGNLLGRLLFRPPSANPSAHPPRE